MKYLFPIIGATLLAYTILSHQSLELTSSLSFQLPETQDATTSLETLLKDKSPREKKELKAQAIIAKTKLRSFVDEKYNLTIEITSIEQIQDGVQLYARAWTSTGQQLGFGENNTTEFERFRFYNPPILVPDNQGDIIRNGSDHEGNPTSHKFREDPELALQQVLAHTIFVSGKPSPNLKPGSHGNTTDTFYPDANVETTSVDGYVTRGANESFSSIRSGAGTLADDSTAVDSLGVRLRAGTSPNYVNMNRAFFLFDTSAIADADTIDSATFSFYLSQAAFNDLNANATTSIFASSPASNTALATTDYGNVSRTAFATSQTINSLTNAAYNDFALNSTGLAAITKTGVSKFSMQTGFDANNVAPSPHPGNTKDIRLYFYTADQTGTTNDPKLVVVHSGSAAPSTSPPKDDIIYID